MRGHRPIPTTHNFKEINVGKYKTVKHYELVDVLNGNAKISDKINISKNRFYARSNPAYWLKEQEKNKWQRNYTTGLFTLDNNKLLLYGDSNEKENLLLFQFSEDTHSLTIHHFENFYPNDFDYIGKTIT